MMTDEIKDMESNNPYESDSMESKSNRRMTFDYLQGRILTFYSEAKMIRKRDMPVPRMAIIYPTYVCNQSCLWCEYAVENEQVHRMMGNEQFRNLINQVCDLGVESVEFCGGGEPTLHPILGEAILYLKKERRINIGIITNGTWVDKGLTSTIVDCCSYVRVGFDSGHKEMFDKVKRPKSSSASFEAVCAKVSDLVRLRNDRGSMLRISIKIVVDENNVSDIKNCLDLASQLGVDSIQFKAARLVPSELTPEEEQQADATIASHRKSYPDLVILGSLRKLTMERQCWLTPLQITIDTLGDVYLCCYYTHRKETHNIGNAFLRPLKDIWYSEKHWEAIESIQPHECNNLDCRFIRYHEILEDLIVEGKGQLEFI